MATWFMLLCIYGKACTSAMLTEPACRAVLTIQESATCVSPSGDIFKSPKKDSQ